MRKIVVIAGLTASGKSTLGIQLAQKFDGEIISADSVAVYKDMNIGSAKPSLTEQSGVVHHLIDIRDIEAGYDVAQFQKEARACIEDICGRGTVPIVVGGTGLYINALVYEYNFEAEKKEDLDLPDLDSAALLKAVAQIDPHAASLVHPNNVKRVERLYRRIVMEHQTLTKHEHRACYDADIYFLNGDRELLYDRMNMRVDAMFERGLVEEVRGIVERIPHAFEYPALSAIGYREFADYFNGTQSLEDTKETIKRNTRRFAKRQVTWFKHQTPSQQIDALDRTAVERVHQSVEYFLGNKKNL